MCGCPQFSFWILIAIAKICFLHSHKLHKSTVALVGKSLKKAKYPRPDLICTVTKGGGLGATGGGGSSLYLYLQTRGLVPNKTMVVHGEVKHKTLDLSN